VLCKRSIPPAPTDAQRATRTVFLALGAFALVLTVVGLWYRVVRDREIVADAARVVATTSPTATPTIAATTTIAAATPTATATATPTFPALPTPSATAPSADDRRAMLASLHIVVYTTQWCPHCKRAKAWMDANSIPYDEKDIDRSRENEAELRALTGRASIPVFQIDGQVTQGFSEGAVLASISRAAARKMGR
jgi:glutaredoxin